MVFVDTGMRVLVVFFWCALSLSATWLLNRRVGNYPPLAKFLDPVSGFWANSEEEGLQAPQTLYIKGLKAPVRVYWDEALIPHIVATHDDDLYLAQGYVTAYHRLWQMEFQLFKTEGRLSEVLGPLTSDYDRWQRRKGLRYAAEATCAEINKTPETKNMFAAYAAGVNAYLSQLSYAEYPIEYKLLDYAPAPWSPYKSCLLMKEMGDILSLDDKDIENTNLLQYFGKDTFDLLFPERHPNLSYIIPEGTAFDFEPLALPPPSKDTLQLFLPPTQKEKNYNYHGSNSAVIAPEKSATGTVLFSSAPDLDLNLPSLWYLSHLIGPEGHTMGGSIPGLPGILIGFNDSIAWGMTNAERDLSDWYHITFTDPSRQEYSYDKRRYKTKVRIEDIQIRDAETLYDTVLYTHHGPVVYDRSYKALAKGANLARRWSGYDPYNEAAMIYYINRAHNYEDAVAAIAHLKTPSQNISFGTAQGDVAIWVQGGYPLKWPGQGKFVMDGTQSLNDWQGLIPQDHALHTKNPAQGFVSAANQHPADETYPYYIYSYNFEYFRGRRLSERLQSIKQVDIKDLQQLQYDNFNYIAYEALPLMMENLDRTQLSVEESKAYDILAHWDYFNKAHLLAPSYFESWFDHLVAAIWDEFEAIPEPKYLPSTYHSIYLMRNYPTLSFYDRVKTPEIETLEQLILDSYQQSVAELQTWQDTHNKAPQWSDLRNTALQHLLHIEPFSIQNLQIGGNHNILNAVKEDHGPSLRLVVSLSPEEVKAYAIYPGSQPGNPGHPAYGNLVSDWVQAKYLNLLFTKDPNFLQKKAIFVQTLSPDATDP